MTPGHRTVYAPSESGIYRTRPWDQIPRKSVQVARAASGYRGEGFADAPFGWDADSYLAFLGLFLAEGCTNSAVRKHHYKTVITQCTKGNQPAVRELLGRLTLPQPGSIRVLPSGNFNVRYYDPDDPIGVHGRAKRGRQRLYKTFGTRADAEAFLASGRVPVRWSLSANGDFEMARKELWEHFRQFGKAHEKFVPRSILDSADTEQLRLMLDWMMFGDGATSRGPNGTHMQYFTTSRQLADDVAEIGVKLGYKVQASHRVLPSAAHRDRYVIYLNGDKATTLVDRDPDGSPMTRPRGSTMSGPRNDVELVPFGGTVYSLQVRDNGNFVLRQNGRVWISGDCRLVSAPAQAA